MQLMKYLLYRVLVLAVVCVCPALMLQTPVLAAETADDAGPARTTDRITGKITEVFNVPGYTYVEVSSGAQQVWVAGPVTPLKVGDTVTFLTEMPMENFHSKAMQRDFPLLYFVNNFITDSTVTSSGAAAPAADPHVASGTEPDRQPVDGITKLENGNTIAEIYAGKNELAGTTIRVRGKVSKYNARVMGRNWLHIRDSSTLDDLTVTTSDTAALDEIVVIEGKLTLEKDFGYGYKYAVIVEDASIVKPRGISE